MADKPVVTLHLPRKTAAQMFEPGDLVRLEEIAELRGPFDPEQSASQIEALRAARVAIAGWGTPPLTTELLASAPNLELIAHSAGSVKGIITEAVFDRGIQVSTAAAANATPVAEFTVAMMVALLKQIPWIAGAYMRGDQEELRRRAPVVRELRDIQVGLISASRVGREVIRLLRAYPRVRVKLHDPFISPSQADEMGVELASLEDTCHCEVVSIHAPRVPATHHMFNARTLALLPDHAILINTARGSLVDENALVNEVSKRPLYVLLDVTDPEPPAPDSPLRKQPNIILTPHIAGSMAQARRDMGRLAIAETLRFLRGERLEHEITREMFPTQA